MSFRLRQCEIAVARGGGGGLGIVFPPNHVCMIPASVPASSIPGDSPRSSLSRITGKCTEVNNNIVSADITIDPPACSGGIPGAPLVWSSEAVHNIDAVLVYE